MSKLDQSKLISLGFAFYGTPSTEPADPEKTIIALLETLYEDRKTFRLLLRWLLITSELIHIERLKALSKDIPPSHKVALGAIATKLEQAGDRRWALISRYMKTELENQPMERKTPPEYSDPYLLHKYGTDPDLLAFGIETSTILPEAEKKILTLQGIIKHHPWLRLRTLIGANFRADVAYLIVAKLALNPNQAAKLLGCSRETAYRLWKSIALYEGIQALA